MSDSDLWTEENQPETFDETPEFLGTTIGRVYDGLRHDGYHRNLALWATWEAHPDNVTRRAAGLPTTQQGLAQMLGVSDRTIRNYKSKYPELVRMAGNFMRNTLLAKYRHDAFDALGKSATNPDYHHASDRRTFFTMTGDLVDQVDMTSKGEQLMPVTDLVKVMLEAQKQLKDSEADE